jgi:hypothetical protein
LGDLDDFIYDSKHLRNLVDLKNLKVIISQNQQGSQSVAHCITDNLSASDIIGFSSLP